MNPASVSYLLFILAGASIYRVVSRQWRREFLLLLSLLFIAGFGAISAVTLIASAVANFTWGRLLARQRRLWLVTTGILIDAGAIFAFNYFSTPVPRTGGEAFAGFSVVLAVGLSFYGLQQIAYLYDVYKARIVPAVSLADYLLVTAWFPKLVAGPICTWQDLQPQLTLDPPPEATTVSGVNRILLGLFKKVVVADRLAGCVSSVFDHNDDLPGITVVTGSILFTIQVYFDFSGYTDMAIGASRLFNIGLRENFSFPLRSTSITVFWRRWHQSLIRFFTAYIFFPITFRLRTHPVLSVSAGIIITFLLSALWHGIGLTFLLWGGCHVVYLLAESRVIAHPNALQQVRSALLKTLLAFYVLLAMSFSHIFFRSSSWHDARYLLSRLFKGPFLPDGWAARFFAPLAEGGHQADYFNLSVTLMLAAMFILMERRIFATFDSPRLRVWPLVAILLLLLCLGQFGEGARFIYMQF